MKMPCNRCSKQLDQEIIEHFRSLAPMTGYNCIPDESFCIVCNRPVCKDCMYGVGMFMFVCREQCKPALDIYMDVDKSKPAKVIVALQRIESGDTISQVASDLKISIQRLLSSLEKIGFKQDDAQTT